MLLLPATGTAGTTPGMVGAVAAAAALSLRTTTPLFGRELRLGLLAAPETHVRLQTCQPIGMRRLGRCCRTLWSPVEKRGRKDTSLEKSEA